MCSEPYAVTLEEGVLGACRSMYIRVKVFRNTLSSMDSVPAGLNGCYCNCRPWEASVG